MRAAGARPPALTGVIALPVIVALAVRSITACLWPGELPLAPGLRLDEGQPALDLLGLGPGLAEAGLQLLHLGASGVDLGIGLGEREPVRLGMETHEQVAGRHDGVVANAQVDDAAGHFAGDLASCDGGAKSPDFLYGGPSAP
jgi:hypothetical protein